MTSLNMSAGGCAGDFIHNLFACKQLCNKYKCKANLYLGGGDPFKFGIERAYEDLKEIVLEQEYINSFGVISNLNEPFINLNEWRREAFKTRHSTGVYNKSWTQIMMDTFNFKFSGEYAWLKTKKVNEDTKNKILVHRSRQRHNSKFYWEGLLDNAKHECLFITSDEGEYENFEQKEKCKLYLTKTISEMTYAIASCKLFVGNQSAPFAIASALDKQRIAELEQDASPFYIGEERYSKNISWFLTPDKKYPD